ITKWANAYATIELEFEYNPKFLELDCIEQSEFSGAMGASNENKFSLICNPSSDRQAGKVAGGEICIAYFYATDDIEYTIPVTVTATVKGYANGKDDNWTATQVLNVEIQKGGVHVEGTVGPPTIYGYAGVTSATAEQGDEVTLTVALGENTSLATYGASVAYDETALKLVSMEEGEFCSVVNAASGMAGGYENTDVTSGTLFTATFKVLASSGDYTVDVIFDAESTKRDDLTPVVMVVTAGVISVIPSSNVPEDYEAVITIDTIKGAFVAGDEIAIPVTISDWANAYGCIEFELNYDKNVLQLDAIEASEICFSGAMTAVNENRFGLIAVPTSNNQASNLMGGQVCVAYFTALTDIVEDTTINFSYVKAYGYTQGANDSWAETKELDLGEVYGGVIAEAIEVPAVGSAIVSDANGEKGETVTVTVSLGENTELAAYGATLVYDETALRLVSIEKGDFCDTVNVDRAFATGYSKDNKTAGTLLFSAEFEILVTEGNYNVSVVFDENSTADQNDKVVTMTATAGTVYVACKHDGNTETRNAVAADCGNDGYTGDEWCLDCNTMIAEGTVDPATGNHVGGTATCISKAVCTVCGQEYGEFDANNHVGETKLVDAVEADRGVAGYTGDLYCLSCGGVIEYGKEIPALNLWGDVNGDGEVNAMDAMLISQYYAELDVEIDTTSADVNGDGYINARDAMLVSQHYVGIIVEFPVER
ncbi:MAG: hypothetical protein IKT35_01590, partial [Clostridia bacterium]|nr:hypothetical protein [Clostridia bacterium]